MNKRGGVLIDTSRSIDEVIETMNDVQKRALKAVLKFTASKKQKLKTTTIKAIEIMDDTQKYVTYALIGMAVK